MGKGRRPGRWKILPEAVRLFCEDKLTVKDNIVTISDETR